MCSDVASSEAPKPPTMIPPSQALEAPSPELPPILLPDELAELTTQVEALGISAEGTADVGQVEDVQILPRCPEGRVITYSLHWYRLIGMPDDVPSYLACSRCYTDHIYDTALSREFEKILWPDSSVATCSFWVPAMKDFFWPDALETGSIDLVREFILGRGRAKPCTGFQGGNRKPGSIWYGMSNSEVQDFMVCGACFQEHIIGTSFQHNFGLYPEEWEADIWICDMRFIYTKRALREYSRIGDWDSFVLGASWRHGIQNCSGDDVNATSTPWYYPRNPKLTSLRVCMNCYLDNWALTAFDGEFQQEDRGPPVGSDDYRLFLVERWQCNVGGKLSLLMAAEASIFQKTFDRFADAVSVMLETPLCTERGITVGEGWTLTGGCAPFVICHACYLGIIWTASYLEDEFQREQWAKQNIKPCSFHKTSPRFLQYINSIYEAVDRQSTTIFSDFVRRYANVTLCPRNDIHTGRRWWGFSQVRCCEECYLDWMSKTSMAEAMPMQGVVSNEGQICQMWSPRMRSLWLLVCEAGELGPEEYKDAVTEFCEIGENRETIYCETVPTLQRLKSLKYAENLNVRAQAMASVQYGGSQAIQVASGFTDGYRHGNSTIGWHDTASGTMAAQARNSIAASIGNASSRDVDIYRLQARWNEVE